MTMIDPIEILEANSATLRLLGARRVGVFGSFARDAAADDSDVDVYVEFEEGKRTYDNFFEMHELLESAFGRHVDLVTDGSLNPSKARLILPTVRYAALDD